MNRRFLLLPAIIFATLLPASCRGPVPVWKEDGRSMTDLRMLRHRAKQSVELTPGVRLFADEIRFTDKHGRMGEATGHVLLDVEPAARYEWMLEHGYAGKASFDKSQRYVELSDMPMLERGHMTMIATAPYTTICVHWEGQLAQVSVRGPTRTDFAKSHPVPPGISFPKTSSPAASLLMCRTLPQRGFAKH